MSAPMSRQRSPVPARAIEAGGARGPSRDPCGDEALGGLAARGEAVDPDLRIGDLASRAGVSTRTLRYYEELGLLVPARYTAGGERRYRIEDLAHLQRILELKDLLGMNLEEIRGFVLSEARLGELRVAFRAEQNTLTTAAETKRRAILEEALGLQTSLVECIDAKLARMAAFRSELHAKARRCRKLLDEGSR